MQNFGGQIRGIVGNVEVAYEKFEVWTEPNLNTLKKNTNVSNGINNCELAGSNQMAIIYRYAWGF